ncbi:MAG: outer membrane protein assembly factor BamA [Proteobacteria bacterium]|nr:outer membrane protein assembly factor BamA [Pseudomonadota bacterium]
MQLKRVWCAGLCIAVWVAVFIQPLAFEEVHAQVPAVTPQAQDTRIVSEVVVEIDGNSNRRETLEALARNLIVIHKNDRFSDERLQDSLAALQQVKMFRHIDVKASEKNQWIAILFRLTPYRRIKNIRVHGKYPLFERDVLNAMTLFVGAVFIPEELEKQERSIADLYRAEGYIAPKVAVTAQADPATGNVCVDVNIDTGDFYSVERVEFKGNQAVGDARLRWQMKTRSRAFWPWHSGRFIEKNLKKDVRNLVDFYRRRKYPEIEIDAAINKDPETRRVSVVMTVSEGPLYKIAFEGNNIFANRTLKKDLLLFKEGNPSDLGLKKSINKIKARYRAAGFLQARIKIEENKIITTAQNIRLLRLIIDEGHRAIVDSIRISGNTAIDDVTIKKQLLTCRPGFLKKGAFVPETLQEDLEAIQALYLKHGFSDTQVNAVENWNADSTKVALNLEIVEGHRIAVDSVSITGLSVVPVDIAASNLMLKAGEPFRKYMLQSDENALSALISEKGYPHVKVKGDAFFNPDRSKVRITYRVDEGPYVVMGSVFWGGNLRTREKILNNEILLKPNDPFSLKQMIESQRNVRNLNSVNSVRFNTAGLREKKNKVNLMVEIEEKKPYYVEAGAGYENQSGFFLHTRTGDHNLFGANTDGWISAELSQIGYRGELGLLEPKLFNTRISATLGLFAEQRAEFNQEFGTRSFGAALGFSQKWLKSLTIGVSFRFEQREQFLKDVRGLPDYSELDPRTIFVTTPSVRYDTRDSFIRPKKGILSAISADISRGLENTLDNFIRYNVDLRTFFSPFEHVTFAGIGRAGYIAAFNSADAVPQDQLFYLGGTSNVRGYAENMLDYDVNSDPLGGRLAVSGSLEVRFDLGQNFELAGFCDAGRLSQIPDSSGSGGFRFSIGTGIRYITPIGPIGMVYGHKINRREGESPGRFHFSIGYTF